MSLPGINEPYPFKDALVEMKGANAGKATQEFDTWLNQRAIPSIDASPAQFPAINDDDLNDAVGLTEILPSAGAGLYRFNPFLQVRTPDGAASSAQITLAWSYLGQSLTKVFSNMNGNTVTTYTSDAPFVFRVDADSPISYQIAYTSTTPNAMRYSLTASLEFMRAFSS